MKDTPQPVCLMRCYHFYALLHGFPGMYYYGQIILLCPFYLPAKSIVLLICKCFIPIKIQPYFPYCGKATPGQP